jgi:hypothetical protein
LSCGEFAAAYNTVRKGLIGGKEVLLGANFPDWQPVTAARFREGTFFANGFLHKALGMAL